MNVFHDYRVVAASLKPPDPVVYLSALEGLAAVQGEQTDDFIFLRNCRKITDATCLGESPEIQRKRL